MNKIKNVKSAIVDGALIIAMMIGVTSCGNSTKVEDTKEVAEESNEAKFDENKTESDADFLVDAAEINLMDIQLGALAMEKAMTNEVKELGKMMNDVHTKSLNELVDLAAKKSVTIPTSLTQDGMDKNKKLMDKTGKEFDKEYCDIMVNEHKDAIDRFEKAANNSTDIEIKDWATATLTTLRKHLDQAVMCQDNAKKL